MVLSSGSLLGPYVILSKIGAGGMGEVYCAKDPRLGRKVAIKILLSVFSDDSERLTRFEQETKSLALLNHPNILHIYDTGLYEGSPFIVMEYLEGQNLRDRMDGNPLPIRKAVEVARQIAIGLAAAHDKGITHRDLKPENIFITEDERVKILDFGLAKLRVLNLDPSEATSEMLMPPSVTQAGMVVGTVGYLSPEQVVGKPADPRSDIFSLGVLLWEMLHGSRPFRGASAVETMHAILKEEPQESIEVRGLPEDLLRIVRRCVEKEPRARFQSAQDLAFDLESISFTTLTRKAISVPSRSWKRMGAWSAGLLGCLLLGACLFHFGIRSHHCAAVSFQRITYQGGRILNARFGPDGQTYVVAVSRSGAPCELRTGRVDGLGTRALEAPPGARVLSISRKSEMAILLGAEDGGVGILARMPMSGGAPRPILEGVCTADWAPNGEDLAVVREGPGGTRRLEYPIGHLLFEAPSGSLLECLRISPDGNQVAFALVHGATMGELRVVNRSGQGRALVKGQCDSLAWSPKGREILYAVTCRDDRREIRAVGLTGESRAVHAVLGTLAVWDMAPDGRALVGHSLDRKGIQVRGEGDAIERDCSWLQSSLAGDLSRNGRQLLFGELLEGKEAGGAYLRRFDEPEPIRLGEGDPLALSPDGQWALVHKLSVPDLFLLPTGTGVERKLPAPGIRPKWGVFLLDNQRLLLAAVDGTGHFGYYLQRLDTGELQPLPWDVAPEAYVAMAPDGDRVAVGAMNGKVCIYSFSGKPGKVLEGFRPGEEMLQWSADGRSLYSIDKATVPARIFQVEIADGRRKLWKELQPVGAPGVFSIDTVCLTPDAKTYAYTYSQLLTSDLYILEGWQ